MKPDMTLSEQKERETLASRVYAATVSWQAAAWERDDADAAERRAWSARAAGKGDPLTLDLCWKLAKRTWEQADARAREAWREREAALEAEKDFRTRMDARPDVTCEGCGAPATVIWSGEGYCADCEAILDREAEQREAEQWTDYYHDACGGLDNGNLRNL